MQPSIVLPSKQHMEWADCEIGVIIHCDLQVFAPEWNYGDVATLPDPSCFHPSALDTDQWLETAQALGAKYAVFVAKHGTGFSMWPTKAHEFSVKNSPWKQGQGDLVADFLKSCQKYGIRPGLYCNCNYNVKYGIDNHRCVFDDTKQHWDNYVDMLLIQLEELWGNYGKLFEIWFDGGHLPYEQGGKRVLDLLTRLQWDTVAFQGDPEHIASVRWIGNERADAPYPACRSLTNGNTASNGLLERFCDPVYSGVFDGKYFCPGEADMPNRDQMHAHMGGWFWRKGEDSLAYPPEELLERYYSSVGRNCNLLLGMVIDDRGLVPDSDVAQFKRTGELIRAQYSHPVGKTMGEGLVFDLEVGVGQSVNMICVMEDQKYGENIREFIVSGFDGEQYHTLVTGFAVGHKFLKRIAPVTYDSYRLEVRWHREGNPPHIREFSLWNTES